jgi:hypothetical protein
MNDQIRKFLQDRNIDSISSLKWAHAVNDIKYLEQTLTSAEVDFLEIDISLSNKEDLIAAHYKDESDLSFDYLLNCIKQSDKGIKLDFKDKKAISPCLQKLQSGKLTQPVILNVDILSVKDAPPAIITPKEFIKLCQGVYPRGLLSVGWRTTEDSIYSAEVVDNMLRACRELAEVTFPVRASALPRSWKNIKRLIEKESYTLTIWNSSPLSQELYQWIIKKTDKNKCFYDFTASKHDAEIS